MIINSNPVNVDTQIDPNYLANLHVWKHEKPNGSIEYLVNENPKAYTDGYIDFVKEHYEFAEIANFVLLNGGAYNYDAFVNCSYGDSVTVNFAGDVALIPTGGSMLGNNDNGYTNLLGKYIQLNRISDGASSDLVAGKVYYVPADATFSYSNWTNTLSKAYEVVGYPETNAGSYAYMGQFGNSTKFASGKYSGNGTETRKIEIGFRPKFFVLSHTSDKRILFALDDGSGFMKNELNYDIGYTISNTGITVASGTSGAFGNHGTNAISHTYNWIAVG